MSPSCLPSRPGLLIDGVVLAGENAPPEPAMVEAAALAEAVVSVRPDAVLDELTDLPDDEDSIPEFRQANARARREGTRNLVAAARTAGVGQFLAQSVAWRLPGDSGAAVEELERSVLEADGVVLRYGQFYGPGTYYEQAPPRRLACASTRRRGARSRRSSPPPVSWR
jgi:hypothetical protein